MSMFSDEGGGFLGGYAMSEDNRLRMITGLSSLWDASALKHTRSSEAELVLTGKRLSLHLMLQPALALPFLNDPLLQNQGLLGRILVSWPSSTMGSRFFQPAPETANRDLAAYTNHLLALLRQPWPRRNPQVEELTPPCLTLTAQAKAQLASFYNDTERQLGDCGGLRIISSLANKATEHVARLAGVLVAVHCPERRTLLAEDVERGIILARYYLDEALRLRQPESEAAGLKDARLLLQWLQTSWEHPAVSVADICKVGPYRLRSKERARQAVEVLVEHHWLAPLDGPVTIGGNKRREAYRIHS